MLYVCTTVLANRLVSLMVLSSDAERRMLSLSLNARPRIYLLWMGTYCVLRKFILLIFFTPHPGKSVV